MNKNYKLYRDSELSEDQVEADVASYLGYVTPFWSSRFQLHSVDEQETGADRLFKRFIPIYLQFKVSEGLKPLGLNFSLSSPNRPLQRIRNFRRNRGINVDPTLYFRLRDIAKTATDFQHNILMSCHQPPKQFAMYVAPLTLSIDEYNESLRASFIDRFFTNDPFLHIEEKVFTKTNRIQFGIVPFLRGHVSIPPHERVITSEHYYSYSKSGGNIAWHSGERMNGDFRLSTQFRQILYYASSYREAGFNKEEFVKFIEAFMSERDEKFDIQPKFIDRMIFEFGYYLKQEYNIKLLILGINDSQSEQHK